MNQGMYRPAPVVPGLPLPRRELPLFTALPLVGAAFGALVALVGFADGGLAAHAAAMREGGLGMYLLLPCALVLPLVLALVGRKGARGMPIPGSILAMVALLPVAVGGVLGLYEFARVEQIFTLLRPEDETARIRMAVTAAVSNLFTLAALAGGAACLTVMLAAGGGVAAIDRTLARAPRAGRVTVVLAASWCLLTVVLFGAFVSKRPITGLSFVSLLTVVVVARFAVLASRNAGVIRDWHDRAEADAHVVLVVLTALAGVFATCSFEYAEVTRATSSCLGAVAAPSVDANQGARILAELHRVREHARCAVGLHLVLGGMTFASALVAAFGRSTRVWSLGRGSDLVVAAFVVTTSVLVGLSISQQRFLALSGSGPRFDRAPLPLVDASDEQADAERGAQTLRLSAGAASTTFGTEPLISRDGPLLDVAADRELAIEHVVTELQDPSRTRVYQRFQLLALRRDEEPVEPRPTLGDLEVLLSRRVRGLPFVLDGMSTPPGTRFVTVSLVGPRLHVMLFGATSTSIVTSDDWPYAPSELAILARSFQGEQAVRLVVRPDERVSRVAAALNVVTRAAQRPKDEAPRYHQDAAPAASTDSRVLVALAVDARLTSTE